MHGPLLVLVAAVGAALAVPAAASQAPDAGAQLVGWRHRDITDFTDRTGAPPPSGRGSSGFASVGTNPFTYYQGVNGHIQEIVRFQAGTRVTDITMAAGAPVPSGNVKLLALGPDSRVYYADNGRT